MTITPAVYLPLVGLSDEHHQLLTKLLNNLSFFQHRNTEKLAYYEGKQRVRQLGITIPPSMRDVEVVVGWPGTTVDVVEERLDWYGWMADNDFGLSRSEERRVGKEGRLWRAAGGGGYMHEK